MIPIRDTARSRRFPVVTVAIIAVNVFAFHHELLLGRRLDESLTVFGVVPARFTLWTAMGGEALDPWRFVPFVTSMFLHGGWLHLLGNLLYLWVFGDNVEDRLGHAGFVLFYLAAGAAAALAQVAALPLSDAPMVGASGAIAGVLGAYFVLFPTARVLTVVPILVFPWFVELPAVVFLGVWFLLQLFSGTAELRAGAGSAGGTAWWAHAGGFVVGAAAGLVARAARPPRRLRRWA